MLRHGQRQLHQLIFDDGVHLAQRPSQRADDRVQTINSGLQLLKLRTHFSLGRRQTFGATFGIRFLVRALLDVFELLHRLAGAARLHGHAVDARQLVTRRRHTNSSPLPPSWMVPASDILRTMARISFCAPSTSDKRTGPRDSRSSFNISAARCDMFLKILALSSSSAPFIASSNFSPGTARSTSCMPRSSISTRSPNTNIRSWILPPSVSSTLRMFSISTLSWLESRKFMICAAVLMPPMMEVLSAPVLPANCFSITSSSSCS